MEIAELTCDRRELKPRGRARQLRRSGRVPAVLYGPHKETVAIAVSAADLKAQIAGAGSQRLVRLKSSVAELDGRHIIFKELQRAAVGGAILHADLYEVDLQKPLRVMVPLKFSGRAKGVADGGILQPLERELEVECLPLEIPEFIEVDVSALGIHDVIHVSTIEFAGNLKPIFDSDYPVVSVLPPTVAEAPVAAAAPAEGEVAAAAGEEGAAAAPAAQPAGEAAGKEPAPAEKAAAGKKPEGARK